MKRLKSSPKDFENIPVERLRELCSFYDNQSQEYFRQMRLAISQLHSAEIQLSKLGFKRGATTVLLIPCKTNTNWWHDFVMPFAEIRFLRGRVAFVYPNGEQSKQALPWPLAFVIYRPNVD